METRSRRNLSDPTGRRVIAERAIAKLSPDELVEGIRTDPALVSQIVAMRPDLMATPTFWSLEASFRPEILQSVAQRPEGIQDVMSAMIAAGSAPVRTVCRVIGNERVLRTVIELLDSADGSSCRIDETHAFPSVR
jgi:hypothetical protein